MRMLTAVGNNGMVYAIEKTTAFDKEKVFQYFMTAEKQLRECTTAEELNRKMNELIEGAQQYGFDFYR